MPPRRPGARPSPTARPARLPSRRAGVGITDADIHDDPLDMTDTLDEDDEVTAALEGRLWKVYLANFRHFIALVLEGWRNEGRRFRTEAAKRKAIARLILGTRAAARKDPRGWVREHCGE